MSSKNAIGRFVKYSLIFLTLLLSISAGSASAQPTGLETVKIDIGYCVKFNFDDPNYIFKTRSALESALSNYGNNIHECLQKIKDLDFTKNTLLGVDIHNSECHSFPLEHKVIKDEAAKLYRFQVTQPPLTIPCAGDTHHQLWVLVPKLPEGYKVAFEISEKKPPEAQFGKEVSIPEADGFPSCLQIDSMVYNDESFKKLLSFAQCAKVFKADQFDLKKQTLIGWQAGGDCHMRIETSLYRDDDKKMFTFVVRNIWGGCRAGGWRQGMFTIDKIPSDYRVKFVEYLVEEYPNSPDRIREKIGSGEIWTADGQKVTAPPASTPEPGNSPPAGGGAAGSKASVLVTPAPGEIEVKILRETGSGFYKCSLGKSPVYTEESYRELIANKDCSASAALNVDLTKESLIGFESKGDCHVYGEAKVFRSDQTKTYTVAVNTIYHGCHAYGKYTGWVVIEKMRPDYRVNFTRTKTDINGAVEVEESP